MVKPKSVLKDVPVYEPGKPIEEVLKEFGISQAVKLASNENPYGFSPKVKEAILRRLDQLYYYPDAQAQELRAALSSFLGVDADQLIFGAGLDEVIQMISRAFLEKGSNTVMALPSFPMYKINALIEGAEVREVPVRDGVHDLQGMLEAIDEDTRIVWICNPNNPTGTYLPERELLSFLERVPDHVLVVFDEAYYEYVRAEDFPRSIPLLDRHPNLIILRTFSKAYGLAGLRIGYGIANKEVIAAIHRVKKPFNTSFLAQLAATAALEDQEFVEYTVEQNHRELQYFYEKLDQLGLKYYPSQTNFVYVETGRPGREIYEELLPYGVIVRPMAGNALRISVGTRQQNEQLFAALERVVAKK